MLQMREFKEHFHRLNLTRIYYLWAEIANLKQRTDYVTRYYSKMKDLWNELDVMVPLPTCDCEESNAYINHLKSQLLLQFLMGIKGSYSNLRSHILSRNASVIVNKTYATMSQEESQRSLGVVDAQKDHLTMMTKRPQGYRSRKPGGSGGSGGAGRGYEGSGGAGIPCIHCGYKGHLK